MLAENKEIGVKLTYGNLFSITGQGFNFYNKLLKSPTGVLPIFKFVTLSYVWVIDDHFVEQQKKNTCWISIASDDHCSAVAMLYKNNNNIHFFSIPV